jgi:predicted nucleotide-binding protein
VSQFENPEVTLMLDKAQTVCAHGGLPSTCTLVLMNKDEAREILEAGGHRINQDFRLPNDSGWQLRTEAGGVVNVYDTGRLVLQGKDKEALELLFDQATAAAGANAGAVAARGAKGRNVFVVYGHDAEARRNLENMLRRWQVNPLILDQLPSEGQTIIEKLERVQDTAHYAVVLATPDDQGHRAGHPDEKKHRARQNVVLELGMLLTTVGRKRVAILLKTSEDMEQPSDIHGLVYLPFRDDVEETKVLLAKELNAAGIRINLDNL